MQVKSLMKVLRIFILLVSFCLQNVDCVSSPHWTKQSGEFCYDPRDTSCGPSTWPGTCQTGQRQSPIDIELYNYKLFKKFSFFSFNKEYQRSQRGFFARNTGHSFQVQFQDETSPSSGLSFSGAALKPSSYIFSQLHFHWGSEHTVHGKRYPLELHIVHYNSKYASLSEAMMHDMDDPEAVAVFAVFFQLGKHNPVLDFIVNVASLPDSMHPQDDFVQYSGPEHQINVQDLLPSKLDFVRYLGSLTTPPCTENVVWTVFTHPLSISEQQVAVFRQIQDEMDMPFMNFRPSQPRNGRSVKYYFVPLTKRSLVSVITDQSQKNSLIIRKLLKISTSVVDTITTFIAANIQWWGALGTFLAQVVMSLLLLPFNSPVLPFKLQEVHFL